MSLRLINVKFYAPYSGTDEGSGRLRVNMATAQKYFPQARINSIVKLKLHFPANQDDKTSKSIIILCTIWPDSEKVLTVGQVCVDDSVQCTTGGAWCAEDWMEASAEVVELQVNPKPCTSVKYRCMPRAAQVSGGEDSILPLIPAAFAHLPVASNTLLRLKYWNHGKVLVNISRTNPTDQLCFISGSNVILLDENAPLSSSSSSTSNANPSTPTKAASSSLLSPGPVSKSTPRIDTETLQELAKEDNKMIALESHEKYSRTKVVDEVIKRVIDPILLDVPAALRFKGLMLLGPPGVGKTYSLRVVQELTKDLCQIKIVQISIPELLSEEKPLDLLESVLNSSKAANRGAKKADMTFLLMDEIDALGHEHNQNEVQMAIKLRLCKWFDEQHNLTNSSIKTNVILLATSNRGEDIDQCLRRGGRLEHELHVLNTIEDRQVLLNTYLQALLNSFNRPNEDGISLFASIPADEVTWLSKLLAEKTGGYVAADIANVMREVETQLTSQKTTISTQLASPTQTKAAVGVLTKAVEEAMRVVQPSCLRGISIQLPRLSFDDVIGCHEAKKQLQQVLAFTNPALKDKFARFGMHQSLGGVLLYGPPGNSKTRLVKATAASFRLPLISISNADIYSAYVGDAEAEIRKVFTIARQASPCILFFDEMDSVVTNRAHHGTSSSSSSSSVEARVLSTFLNEMDGINGSASSLGVIVIGATNRIDCIDSALLRKGRFYQTVHIAPPTAPEREELLHYFVKQANLPDTAEGMLKEKLYDGMSGAQIEQLCKEVAMAALPPTTFTE